MARSGPGAGEPPVVVTGRRGSGSVSRPEVPDRDRKTAWRLVVLAMVWHVLRSRRLYEGLAVTAIVLVSLSRLGQESGTGWLGRMAAWERREAARLERKASRRRLIARRRRTERQRASSSR
jgi:hypothetical protein